MKRLALIFALAIVPFAVALGQDLNPPRLYPNAETGVGGAVPIGMDDDICITFGDSDDYELCYDSAATAFEIRSLDCDGAGADCDWLVVDDGTDDPVLSGSLTVGGQITLGSNATQIIENANGIVDIANAAGTAKVRIDAGNGRIYPDSSDTDTYVDSGTDYLNMTAGNTLIAQFREGTSDRMEVRAQLRLYPNTNTLDAGDAISSTAPFQIITGNGGPVTLTSTPSITVDSTLAGVVVTLFGDGNAVTIQDNDQLAGTLVELQSNTEVTIGAGDWIECICNGASWLCGNPNNGGAWYSEDVIANEDLLIDDTGTSVNSNYLYLRGDNSGSDVETRMYTAYGAQPYLVVGVSQDGSGTGTVDVVHLDDNSLRPASGGGIALGATSNYFSTVVTARSRNIADADTIPDSGDGAAATANLEPASGNVQLTCNDGDGCDITMLEAEATNGDLVRIKNVSANVCNFADTAGLSELTGAFAMGQYDSLTLEYLVDRWVEISRSDN